MAKKKRSASLQEESEDEQMDDSEEEDMSEDEKGEDAPESAINDGEIPFLDTFYGLASASPAERAQSAHAMLQHCLLGPSANSKDAAYAFRRLLNGLCSGRAAARQGYASSFASFLKIAYATGALEEIQKEATKDEETDESLLEFVRNQLLKTTDPVQAQGGKFGKVKGSEERDYQFGRLFGILGVVRSGILVPSEARDTTEIKEVSLGFVNDLIDLFHHKKWMREPTAHGIITLMNALCDSGDSDDHKMVLDHLVKQAIVPKLFAGKGVDRLNAEQIAVAVSIQRHDELFNGELPSPLNQAIVSSATIPMLVDALSSTSSVVHPRMHVVWEVLWLFLTEETTENGRVRTLCKSCPISDESGSKVAEALIQNLVTQSLLAIGADGDGSNLTHERRALALSIVRAACGGQLNSSSAGEFVISADLEMLENVILSSDIIRRLFLDVICAGGNAKGAHMLKPLALHVLDTIVENEALNDTSSAESLDRRLSIAKALLTTDPRFDGRTRTSTVSNLLLLNDTVTLAYSQGISQMWTKYIDFLENQILRTCLNDEDDVVMEGDGGVSQHETLGYIDLLFNAAKRILRLQVDDDKEGAEFEKFKSTVVQRIMGFFMASAFFDCSNLSEPKKRKKKKGRKESFDTAEMHPVVLEGIRIKEHAAGCSKGSSTLPYNIRIVLSSRFFSLLADCTSVATVRPVAAPSKNKQSKDVKALEILSDVVNGWIMLEDCGAQSLAAVEETEDESNGAESISAARGTVHQMQQDASMLLRKGVGSVDDEVEAKTRCSLGCVILASTLCLQFLRCGASDEIVDEIEEDDGEEDDDDIIEMISDLRELPSRLIEVKMGESSEDQEDDPLMGLTELCIQVLSSQVGSGGQSRGALPKLLREAVKFAWIGGLSAYAAADGKATLNDEVLESLLGAIGAAATEESDDNGAEDASDSGEEDSDSDESDQGKPVFSQAAGEALGLDDDSSDVEMKDGGNSEPEEEEDDVELDPAQLESMLLEDGDAILEEDEIDVGELEHHAGADAALAQLIKLKQDARKAGRQALERLEISKQLRCSLLLDTLLSNPGRHWSNLLQPTVFMKLVLPLLQARRDLEKSLERASANQLGKKSTGLDNEKRALLERLTFLLKTKLCKVRWTSDVQAQSTDMVKLSAELMNQARKSNSSEHASCSSSALLAMLKSLKNADDIVNAAGVYSEALTEWSTKRSTKLPTVLFDDLIQQLPSLAQVVLVVPLSMATKEARSPYLKAESFRLLGSLFGRSGGQEGTSEVDARGSKSLEENSRAAVKCICDALSDDGEMLKTKRVKEVLKAAEKVIAFQETHPDASISRNLVEMKACVEKLKDNSESMGVKSICEKLTSEIDDRLTATKQDIESGGKDSESTKKKKKKKGKKKK